VVGSGRSAGDDGAEVAEESPSSRAAGGNSKPQPTAGVKRWLPGDEATGLGSLQGRNKSRVDPGLGADCVFGLPAASVRLLQPAPALTPSETVNVINPHPLFFTAAVANVAEPIATLQE